MASHGLLPSFLTVILHVGFSSACPVMMTDGWKGHTTSSYQCPKERKVRWQNRASVWVLATVHSDCLGHLITQAARKDRDMSLQQRPSGGPCFTTSNTNLHTEAGHGKGGGMKDGCTIQCRPRPHLLLPRDLRRPQVSDCHLVLCLQAVPISSWDIKPLTLNPMALL